MVKAVVLGAPHQAPQVQTLSEPTLEPGAVVLETIFAEVCGTDIHLVEGRLQGVPYPIIPGHFSVGTVMRTGGSVHTVDGRSVVPGDVVTFLDVFGTCNNCWHCLVAKAATRCPSRRVYGVTCSSEEGLLGGWSEQIYLKPDVKMLHLPPEVSPLRFISAGCALPTAVHAVERAEIKMGDLVVVQGAGPVGLCAAIAAKLVGAKSVVVLDLSPSRIKVAEHFGFETILLDSDDFAKGLGAVELLSGGRGADVTIEATGSANAFTQGLRITRDGGRYVVVGHYTDSGSISLNPHVDVNRKHIEIRGVWGVEFRHFYLAMQLLVNNSTIGPFNGRWEDMVGKIYSLDEVNEALDAVRSREIVKAIISPNV